MVQMVGETHALPLGNGDNGRIQVVRRLAVTLQLRLNLFILLKRHWRRALNLLDADDRFSLLLLLL